MHLNKISLFFIDSFFLQDQSIQEGTAEANRKFKYYMILIVILFLASIAAIEVAYQKYFKHKGKPSDFFLLNNLHLKDIKQFFSKLLLYDVFTRK